MVWVRQPLPTLSSCLTSRTMLRFHIPFIEPDGREYRIRLLEKAHGVERERVAVRLSPGWSKKPYPARLVVDKDDNLPVTVERIAGNAIDRAVVRFATSTPFTSLLRRGMN